MQSGDFKLSWKTSPGEFGDLFLAKDKRQNIFISIVYVKKILLDRRYDESVSIYSGFVGMII